MKRARILLAAVLLLPAPGCAAIADALIRKALGVEDRDRNSYEERRRKERKLKEERKWIRYWRDHPNENPAMTEAFKDDHR